MRLGLFSRCLGCSSTFCAMTKDRRAFDGVRCLVGPQPVTMRIIMAPRLALSGIPADRIQDFEQRLILRTSIGFRPRVPQEWAKHVCVPTFLFQVHADVLTDPQRRADDIRQRPSRRQDAPLDPRYVRTLGWLPRVSAAARVGARVVRKAHGLKGVCEVLLHGRPARRPRLREPDHGDRPSDGRLPGQPRRSPIPLYPRGRQDCSARDRAVSFDLELTGRRALVTAGTKGVGAAVVDVLHNAGATVAVAASAIPADARTDVHYIAADMTTLRRK